MLQTYPAASIVKVKMLEGKEMVAQGGIEPPTRGFSVRCSTN